MLPSGKQGMLQRDQHGYFLGVPLGAYDAFNSAGFRYDAPSALNILAPNSVFMRMIQKGVLYAEYTHPEMTAGMRDMDYLQRIRRVDMKLACAHIRAVYVTDSRDSQGRPIKLVTGDILPYGPYGQYVEQALSNPCINSYFSVRSITMDDRLQMIKYTREIVTWDFVGEGGILEANKYNSPSLEGYQDPDARAIITPDMLWKLADEQKRQQGLGFESAAPSYESLAQELGWQRQQARSVQRPSYHRW